MSQNKLSTEVHSKTHIRFFSRSKHTYPGNGKGEVNIEGKCENWDKLASIQDFRKVLSNFYLCDIVVYGVSFRSVEHAFQASKYSLVKQTPLQQVAEEFNKLSPVECKKATGKSKLPMTTYMFESWNKIKNEVLFESFKSKFQSCKTFREILVLTKDAKLTHIVRAKPDCEMLGILMKKVLLLSTTEN